MVRFKRPLPRISCTSSVAHTGVELCNTVRHLPFVCGDFILNSYIFLHNYLRYRANQVNKIPGDQANFVEAQSTNSTKKERIVAE